MWKINGHAPSMKTKIKVSHHYWPIKNVGLRVVLQVQTAGVRIPIHVHLNGDWVDLWSEGHDIWSFYWISFPTSFCSLHNLISYTRSLVVSISGRRGSLETLSWDTPDTCHNHGKMVGIIAWFPLVTEYFLSYHGQFYNRIWAFGM